MSFGRLRGAFRPQGDFCALRCVARQREMLIRYQARHVQHIQKALTQMNLQLGQVISDVACETGQRIVRAIVAGERDGAVLAKLRHARIRASEEEIAKALQGTWRDEHLFALKQAVALYDAYAEQLAECDRQLATMLAALARHEAPSESPRRRGRPKQTPKFDLRTYLFQLCGVDLTRIDGIDVTTAFKVLAEIGADLSRFKSAKHFASWLGLCPGTKISGGKVLSGASKRTTNRAAQALKLAASNLRTRSLSDFSENWSSWSFLIQIRRSYVNSRLFVSDELPNIRVQALRTGKSDRLLANRPWAPTIGACAPVWTSPAPSPPAPTSWPA